MTNFDSQYLQVVSGIMKDGAEEYNERTGYHTRIKTGLHFDFNLQTGFPLLTLRKMPLKLFISEQVWFIQGDKNLDFVNKFTKIWQNFAEEDGTVSTAYGYRWNNFFERNQLDSLVEMLKSEPSSRQGVVVTWDPNSDGLVSPKKKNVPCVPVWMANIVDGKLNFHVIFRSNDVMLGMPHDIAGFALLQHMLAQEVGRQVGYLHYSVSHAHIYENHYEQAQTLMDRENQHQEIKLTLPDKSFQRAKNYDEALVEEIRTNIKSQYDPLPSLGHMQIAL